MTRITSGQRSQDGAGVNLTNYIPFPATLQLDPFLLLDVIKSDNANDYIKGFPPHPHRGFQTVTYLLAGRVRHRDSAGHSGLLQAGGVQWMTAGSGIEHSEIPEQESGLLFGFQLWLNLPAANKMQAPSYQDFEPAQIPEERRSPETKIRVITGTTAQGTTGPVKDIATSPQFFDVQLAEGGTYQETIPSEHTAFLFIIEGDVTVHGPISSAHITSNQLAVLSSGDKVSVEAASNSRFLLISGRPLHEPITRHGPFVMNTQEELVQAYRDYEAGNFGHVEGEP
ncbi:MAG: pirin family protein [Chromatiales bacterium]|nr:pirin family protein [Chromatiales bacterium]